MNPDWLVAAGLTLAGSVHCVGMCGGFVLAVAAGGQRVPRALLLDQLLLQLGKASSYALLGAVAGAFGAALISSPAWSWAGRVLAVLAGVAIAAVVAARTGNAADYFLPSLLANVASALIWAASILARWPLLGVIVGFAIGQKTSWRQDPALVRAYGRASWIWAGSFLVRAGVNTPLYLTDNLLGLGISRVLLGWPMVLLVIAASWWMIRRSLPADHPGIMHPRVHREEPA